MMENSNLSIDKKFSERFLSAALKSYDGFQCISMAIVFEVSA
jgi:hypothetical protein